MRRIWQTECLCTLKFICCNTDPHGGDIRQLGSWKVKEVNGLFEMPGSQRAPSTKAG